MFNVTKVYTVKGSSITIEDSGVVSPVELASRSDINTKLYICVEVDEDNAEEIKGLGNFVIVEESGVKVGLSFSRMLVDQMFSDITTWDELCDKFTDEILMGYSDTIPGYNPGARYPRHQVITWDVMTVLNTFNVVLYNHRSFEEPRIKHTAEDIYITIMPGAEVYPDLSTCIPVVNGYVCRPLIHKGGMIVKGAAKLFWNASANFTPEIHLLDFSRIGTLYTVPIHKDNVSYKRGTYQLNIPNLPLSENTYMPVINGTLILPDRYITLDDHNIKFTPHQSPMNLAFAYRGFLDGEIPSESQTAYGCLTVDDYLKGQLDIDAPEITDDFTIVVGSPIMYVARYRLDIFNNGFIMNLHNEEGILFNERTGLVMDYHRVPLTDRQELLVQSYDELYITDRKYDDEQVAFIRPDSDHTDEMYNIHHGDTTMVYLMR